LYLLFSLCFFFDYILIICRKDAVLKVQLISGLSLEAGDSEDEDTESSSEEEDEESNDSQKNLPPSKSSWCVVM
jgi:hypothetical protein